MKLLPSLAAIFLTLGMATADDSVYVSPSGRDTNPGTRSRPFHTLERARDYIRSSAKPGLRTVTIRGGTYTLSFTLELGKEDSGSTWQAAKGEVVRLVGGSTIPNSSVRAVESADVLARLAEAARPHVREVDLGSLNVKNLPAFPVSYHGAPPGPELFVGDQRMRLASWPNEGWATIAKIIEPGSRPRDGDMRGLTGTFEYSGDRPARWKTAEGVWLQGYWCYDWYDEVIQAAAIDVVKKTIRLAVPHVYGLMQGNPSPRRYRALNVLEELDAPGEFVIDRAKGKLYFWPPDAMGKAKPNALRLSTLDKPLVAIRDASNVTLRGFIVEAGLDNGIEVHDGSGCKIDACEVQNMRRVGIVVKGGTRHTVSSCSIHHTGQGGLVLEGGDRKRLTPAGHWASNNHIWRFSEHQLTSAYGLTFGGVGNRAMHNFIHDAPHQAIFVGGNDHIFEYNEIARVCTETDDCGALYKGRNPSCRGNIIRYNYWHDIGSPMGHGNAAIYFDDGDGGDIVFGNLFVRCGDPGRGSFGTVFSHGGHGIKAENNLFVDCKRALGSAPWDDKRWREALNGGEECYFPEKLLKEVDITKPPYLTHYPELAGFMDPPPNSRKSVATSNVMVRSKEASSGNWVLESGSNLSLSADPGFVNAAIGDYRLRPNAEIYRKAPWFKPLPFEKMGLLGKTQPTQEKRPNRRLVLAEYGSTPNRFVEVGIDGKIAWEFKPPSISVIFQLLPNGHILLGYGGAPTGVQEIDRGGKVVWNYVSKCPQVLGCERLPNGNTLVAEQGPCQAVEVDPQGKVVHITPLSTSEKPYHLQVRNVHKLPNGNILAAHEGEGAAREVDPTGTVVWEYKGVENTGDALRLPNGNTLISCGTQKRVIEVTPDGKIAWQFTAADAPDLNIVWVSSIQRLKNGNLLIGNFLRGHEGVGAHAFEVTRNKKVVWTYADHSLVKSLTTARAIGE
jgi:hypothetical protein